MDHDETQAGLARRLGITRQRVWQWEMRGVPEYDARIVQLALDQLDENKDQHSLILKVQALLNEIVTTVEGS